MTTEVYGFSDDLIEIAGDISEECSGGGEPVLLIFSDGTFLTIKYGKEHLGIWAITLLTQGGLFRRIGHCNDEDADRYSDTAYFNDGMEWVYLVRKWRHIKSGD
ncbi:MAG: hypothetical protein KAI64_04890 [Thermoplasmata archaeon]|nr:hypothetical protein [Thermoplasmata archaeon]